MVRLDPIDIWLIPYCLLCAACIFVKGHNLLVARRAGCRQGGLLRAIAILASLLLIYNALGYILRPSSPVVVGMILQQTIPVTLLVSVITAYGIIEWC